jgi:beta-1,4-mannooligosaccharide/beta-1,4-mannosyl-N-acetylglucosamine phosphorylase
VALAAWQNDWESIYYGGIMLLDLDDPSRIVAIAKQPLIVPDQNYELDGFRGGVVFPGGIVAEADGTAKIYYGAADTVECLASAKIDDLIAFCFQNNCMQAGEGYEKGTKIYAH